MRFCENHWDKLKNAINERNLSQYIPKNGEEAARRFVAGVEGGDPKASFDPLMYAHNAIVSNAVGASGLAVMMQNEDGSDRCPICFLKTCPCGDSKCADGFEGWVIRAADDALAVAKELGLVASA